MACRVLAACVQLYGTFRPHRWHLLHCWYLLPARHLELRLSSCCPTLPWGMQGPVSLHAAVHFVLTAPRAGHSAHNVPLADGIAGRNQASRAAHDSARTMPLACPESEPRNTLEWPPGGAITCEDDLSVMKLPATQGCCRQLGALPTWLSTGAGASA